MKENVVTHYMPLNYDKKTGKPVEKGIDVWLALEAYELAIYKRFDVLVLIACDSDYVPLVRKINTVGSQVMLLSWDLKYHDESGNERITRTSQHLLEGVSHYVPMHERIDARTSENDSSIKDLFVQKTEKEVAQNAPHAINKKGIEDVTEDIKESTILSIKNGYGFIEDKNVNNVYFYHGNLEDIDFNDLKSGMTVKYVQSERDGKYIATKVWMA